MKIDDAEAILLQYSKHKLNSLKGWIKDDAPHLYENWRLDAEVNEEEYARYFFNEYKNSEWFVRSIRKDEYVKK